MKVVINACFGGFSLSTKAYNRLRELNVPLVKPTPDKSVNTEEIYEMDSEHCMGSDYQFFDNFTDDKRNHPLLIQVVEELGAEANGPCAKLKIVEIPDDVKWHIHEYDGYEYVAENHRTWD